MHLLLSYPYLITEVGTGATVRHQANALAEWGVEVTLVVGGVVPGTVVDPRVSIRATRQLGTTQVPVRALGGADRARHWHDWITAKIIEHDPSRYDMVHGWPGVGARTFAAAHRFSIPSVREAPNTHTANAYEVVGVEMAHLGLPSAPGHSHTLNPDRLAAEEVEYTSATAVLCPAESVARTFLARGFDDRRLLRTQYGYDPESDYADTAAQDGPARLVFVGRCEPRKALHVALDAWIASGGARTGAQFVLVGDWYPGYAEMLGDRLTADGVSVRGFTQDAAEEMSCADILVLPSLEEGSALVTYEAQAAGCALLVSDETGAVCEQGVQGRVHPAGDVAALAADMALLTSDRALLNRMRVAARENAKSLTWTAAASLLVERYSDALRLDLADRTRAAA